MSTSAPPTWGIGLRRSIALFVTMFRLGAGPILRRVLHRPQVGPSAAERLRIGFERLGVTYIKLGQYLAMRFDILPADVCRELGRLFDDVAAMDPGTARAVVEAELGHPVEQRFSSFNGQPIAAASIAQVHEAVTAAGERVAVKVQRVGLRPVLQADLRTLRRLTRVADAFHALGRLSATEMLDQFAAWTYNELDFELEARTAEAVRAKAGPDVVIPRVHFDLTTSKVLTLEFVSGISLAEVVRQADEHGPDGLADLYVGLDIGGVLKSLAAASLQQIFVEGRFHGDPHPGNILITDEGQVAFVDFGIFGELGPHDRRVLASQIESLAVGNIEDSLDAYMEQLIVTEDTDLRAFRQAALAVLQEWYDVSIGGDAPLAQRHVGRYIGRMIDISRRYGLRYDMKYLLYWRALNALDSTALRLSSNFDLVGELRTFFEQHQPTVLDRLRAVTGRSNRLAIAGIANLAPPVAKQVLDQLADRRSPAVLDAVESTATRRRRDLDVSALASSIAGTSLAIIAFSADVPPLVEVISVGAAIGFGVVGWRRAAPL